MFEGETLPVVDRVDAWNDVVAQSLAPNVWSAPMTPPGSEPHVEQRIWMSHR